LPGSNPKIEAPTVESVLRQTSRRRWVILALIFTVTVINFIDRQTLSVLAPVLRATYHLSNEAYGRIVAALQFGMMSGEFPMGWLMDRIGARLGLTAAVLWWSAATGAQAFTRTGIQLGITRYWMGTGEAGNYPGGMKALSRIFSREQRTLAIGIFNSGSMIGATIAPPLIVFLMQTYGFRAAFLAPALLGAIWAPIWWSLHPRHQTSGSSDGGSSDGPLRTPLTALLKQSSAWAVMLCRFSIGPVIQFYWYWIPSYLYSFRHMSLTQIGFLAWIPFFLGDTGGVLGGWTAGWLQRRKISIYRVRQITMYSSSLLCMTSLTVPYLNNAAAALITLGVAILAHNFLSANMFGAITDLYPDHTVGRATGLTGVAGGLSGLLFPLLTGALVDHISYTPVFFLIAFMPLMGTLALFILGKQYRSSPTLSPQNLSGSELQ
jgi:ACS family hexuronate transporter-like MFS transporter